jgi:hypothetical protein
MHFVYAKLIFQRLQLSETDISGCGAGRKHEMRNTQLKEGAEGEFTTFGAKQPGGHLVIKTILPSFAPRRLFEPDSTARMDTHTHFKCCAKSSAALRFMLGSV